MSIYQGPREAWLYQRLAGSAGHDKRPKLRKILGATIRYAVLFIVIELACAAIIMYMAARNDASAGKAGTANRPPQGKPASQQGGGPIVLEERPR
jgi:hypothetical protein